MKMFEINELNDEVSGKLKTIKADSFVEIKNGSHKCVMVKRFINEYLEGIKNFQVFEDDIWVISYPKCGTTWTQEMVWLLNNDLDYETALNTKLTSRFPYLEIGGLANDLAINTLEACANLPKPRHIKTHLPVFLLPNQLWTVKPKIIYVTRNPKDAAVSYFHHHRNLICFLESKEVFFEAFLQDKIVYSPFDSHVIEFWKLSKKSSNILFLFYEDMKKNLDYEVKKTMKFLHKAYSQNEIDKLCKHLSFDSMKKNPSCNFEPNVLPPEIKEQSKEKFEFIRQGKTGSHKKEMTEDQIELFNEYIKRFSEFPELAAAFSDS